MKVSNLEIILDKVMVGVDEASVEILKIYNDNITRYFKNYEKKQDFALCLRHQLDFSTFLHFLLSNQDCQAKNSQDFHVAT